MNLLNLVPDWLRSFPWGGPVFCAALFLAASFLMIWRLESLSAGGFEGTVLGTLVMPYCSGLGNLIFAVLLGIRHSPGSDVVTNCLVNNVTNVTLLIGLPALFWGMVIVPEPKKISKRKKKGGVNVTPQLDRLSLLLTLLAAVFFMGVTWAVAGDRVISFSDGLVLVGVFGFWQLIHVIEVLKNNVRENRKVRWSVAVDFLLIGIGAYGIFFSTNWLVEWISSIKTGFISARHLGWLSGWLMVLPNGMLALYYAWKRKAEIVYTSQVGDGHICIPLSIGVIALFQPTTLPPFFHLGMVMLVVALAIHTFCVVFLGKLPRLMGAVLCVGYAVFVYRGLIP